MPTTTTTLTSSVNPAGFGDVIMFTASAVSDDPINFPGPPNIGTFQFFDGVTLLDTIAIDGAGNGFLFISTLDVLGSPHDISAVYSGGGIWTGGTSNHVSQVIFTKPTTTSTLVSSLNPSTFGALVTFTVTVVSDDIPNFSGPPTGTVEFFDGATSLGSHVLDGAGQFAFNISSLSVAGSPHSISAVYSGDSVFQPSTSNTIAQAVTVAPVTITITSSTNWAPIIPNTAGNVFYTAVLSSSGEPSGIVTFKLGPDVIGTSVLVSGQCTFFLQYTDSPIPALTAIGPNTITAEYAGDGSFDAATGSHSQDIGYQTHISFYYLLLPVTIAGPPAMPNNPIVVEGTPVTLIAAVGIASPIAGWLWTIAGATGTITFKEGSTVLGVIGVDPNVSKASITLFLPVGTHVISAEYTGAGLFWPGSTDIEAFKSIVTVTPAEGGETTPPIQPTNPNESALPSPPPITKIPCPVVITCPDPLLSNYSMEQSDGPSFHSVAFPIFDPYDPSWRATNCIGQECESTVSQEDADLCARRLSDECQGATFFSSSASCSTLCFDGLAFVYTVPAGLFVSTSQDLANRIAFEYACLKARQHIICLSDLTGECSTTNTISFTVTASGFFLDHTGNANFWALTFGALPTGMTVTTGFLNDTVLISGTPSTPGVYTFTIQVTAPNGDYMGKEYVVEVLPTAPPNVAINQALAAPTGAGTGRALTGTLPPGTRLAQDINGNDILLGTPTTNGTCAFTITYT